MGHPMHCPVCEEDFEAEIKCMAYIGGTIDSCGEPNTNITVNADCPNCDFTVIADFVYDALMSKSLMRDANEDTHEPVSVKIQTWGQKWMTKADAAQYFKDEGLE
jgi:dihydroorotate dehydrogenase|tara:strand:+ start:767 stop:1081 length:315 start_codon:yes stop_codon:yes gene_type:complete